MQFAARFYLLLVALLVSGPAGSAPVSVETRSLADIAVYPSRSAPATVVSNSEIEISAEIAARVVRFDARVGDIIEAGAALVALDCRDYELDLASARATFASTEARLKLATVHLDRARELSQRNVMAAETFDERQAERSVQQADLVSARTAIKRAELAVSRCTVRSPFRALLHSRLAPVGQFVATGEAVARLIDVGDVELSAQVLAGDVAAITDSDALSFVDDEQRYPVTLRAAVAALDSETRQRELRLRFNVTQPLTGTAGQLSWQDRRTHVPGNLLVARDGVLGLFVIVDGRASFVIPSNAQAGRASVVSLAPDTAVVVAGHYGLQDGQAVQVISQP
jgi:RND family efflux transporter MFP subunit